MTRRVPASIAELTQICRATPRRLALRISRPALKFKRLQCRGGEKISFVSIDKRAGGVCGRGMTETFITLWRCRVASGKKPEIYRYTKPSISSGGSTAFLSKAFNLTAAYTLPCETNAHKRRDQGRNDLRRAGERTGRVPRSASSAPFVSMWRSSGPLLKGYYSKTISWPSHPAVLCLRELRCGFPNRLSTEPCYNFNFWRQ